MNGLALSFSAYFSSRYAPIEAYVPLLLQSHLFQLENEKKLNSYELPFIEKFEGTVMFMDISGFTPITEALQKLGPEGAEIIRNLLVSYFSKLFQVVEKHAGDVVKFAGDALLIVWKDKDLESRKHILDCALESVKIQLNDYFHPKAKGIDTNLHIKIAIGTGTTYAIHVGLNSQEIDIPMYKLEKKAFNTITVNRKEFLILGSALQEMAKCMEDAITDQVIVSPSFFEGMEKDIIFETKASGNILIKQNSIHLTSPSPMKKIFSPTTFSEELLKNFLDYTPLIVRKEFADEVSPLVASIRQITCVFISLYIDTTTEQSISILQGSFSKMNQIIFQFSGEIRQYLVDDKGPVLIAIWGLPSTSSEQDTIYAVEASFSISKVLHESFQISASIGITTGYVFCGTVGPKNRCEYAVIGDTVNLSARLMSAAKKLDIGILCDEKTYTLCDTRIIFQTLEPIKVKGKSEDIHVYHPIDIEKVTFLSKKIRSMSTLKLPMIGRKFEIAFLQKHFEALRTNQKGKVIFIQGLAGSGKSTLIRKFVRSIESNRVLKIQGSERNRLHSYYAVSYLIYKLLNEDTDKTALQNSILNLFSKLKEPEPESEEKGDDSKKKFDLVPFLALLNPLLGTNFPISSAIKNLNPELKGIQFQEIVLEIIKKHLASMDSEIVLIFEDYHWVDQSSCALFNKMIKLISEYKVLLILTSRPIQEYSYLKPVYECLQSFEHFNHLTLEEMKKEEIIEIAETIFKAKISPSVQDLLLSKAGGNPLFIELLCLQLKESNILQTIDNHIYLKEEINKQNLVIPDNIEKTVITRLDKLSSNQQLILKIASVIGFHFPLAILQDTLRKFSDPIPYSTLIKELNTLEDLHFIFKYCEKPIEYHFYHEMSHDIIYNSLSFGTRQKMHLAIAKWYEMKQEVVVNSLSILAHHWEKALNYQKALQYYTELIQQSLKNWNVEESLSFLNNVIQLSKEEGISCSIETRMKWYLQISYCCIALGKREQSRKWIEELFELVGEPSIPDKLDPNQITELKAQLFFYLAILRFRHKKTTSDEKKLLLINAYERLISVSQDIMIQFYILVQIMKNIVFQNISEPEIFGLFVRIIRNLHILDNFLSLSSRYMIENIEKFLSNRISIDDPQGGIFIKYWQSWTEYVFPSNNSLTKITSEEMETISLKCIELIQSSGVLVQLDTMISLEDYLGVLGNIYLVSGKFLKGLKFSETHLSSIRSRHSLNYKEVGVRLKCLFLYKLGYFSETIKELNLWKSEVTNLQPLFSLLSYVLRACIYVQNSNLDEALKEVRNINPLSIIWSRITIPILPFMDIVLSLGDLLVQLITHFGNFNPHLYEELSNLLIHANQEIWKRVSSGSEIWSVFGWFYQGLCLVYLQDGDAEKGKKCLEKALHLLDKYWDFESFKTEILFQYAKLLIRLPSKEDQEKGKLLLNQIKETYFKMSHWRGDE